MRLLAWALVGAFLLLGLVTCDDVATARACGQGPISSNVKRPDLIFACSAVSVDGAPYYQLWRLLPHGAERLSSLTAEDPAVAPSGSRLAYESTASGMPEVYVSPGLTPRSRRAVAAEPGGQHEPAWSPDGSHLAYESGQEGLQAQVGVSTTFGSVFVSTAGGGDAHRITPYDAYYGQPAWEPMGNRIALATDYGGYWNVDWTTDGTTDRPHPLTRAGEAQWPTWSPGGMEIAYQWSATLNGEPSIWVMDANGQSPHRLTSGSQPAWSPDGKWIAFVRTTEQGSDLWMISSDSGQVVRLTDDAGPKGRPTWVPPRKTA